MRCIPTCSNIVLTMVLAMPACGVLRAQDPAQEIISNNVALRHGLRRAWIGQVRLDRTRERLVDVVLSDDTLFALTSSGGVQSLDAETGRSRWLTQVGSRDVPSVGPAASAKSVAVVNGTTLYLLDRHSGELLWEKSLRHIPFAAPAVTDSFVYVPLFNGIIAGYNIEKPTYGPWLYQSVGRVDARPLTTPQSVAWVTSRGYLYAGSFEQVGIRFQFETGGPITAPIAYRDGYFYIVSHDGFAYAVNEESGQMQWRFSAGSPMSHPAVAIGDAVYVVPEAGGMFCLARDTGLERWYASRITKFVAVSPARAPRGKAGAGAAKFLTSRFERIYASDTEGQTVVLDARTGAALDALPTAALTWKLINAANDRLYEGTPSGLIQCFHEPDIAQPVSYLIPSPADAAAKPKDAAAKKGPAKEADESEDAAADESMPAEDTVPEKGNPFDEPEPK